MGRMASPSGPRPAAARGVLRDVPVAHALVYLREKRLTGTYEVRTPDGREAHLLLWRGNLADAVVLGRFEDEGRLARAVTEASAENRMRSVVRRVFAFPSGSTFVFREVTVGEDATEPHLLLDLLGPVWRGLVEHPDDARIREAIAKVGASPLVVVSASAFDAAELDAEERALCDELAGAPRSAEEILASDAAARLGKEHAELLVYFLVLVQAATPIAAQEVARGSGMRAAVLADLQRHPPSFRMRHLDAETSAAVRLSKTPEELGKEGVRLRASRIGHETAYEALGVDGGASPEEIRAAYFRLARAWNPARLAPEMKDVQDDVARVHAWLATALRAILDTKAAGG